MLIIRDAPPKKLAVLYGSLVYSIRRVLRAEYVSTPAQATVSRLYPWSTWRMETIRPYCVIRLIGGCLAGWVAVGIEKNP
jgi:hypothetical protein